MAQTKRMTCEGRRLEIELASPKSAPGELLPELTQARRRSEQALVSVVLLEEAEEGLPCLRLLPRRPRLEAALDVPLERVNSESAPEQIWEAVLDQEQRRESRALELGAAEQPRITPTSYTTSWSLTVRARRNRSPSSSARAPPARLS